MQNIQNCLSNLKVDEQAQKALKIPIAPQWIPDKNSETCIILICCLNPLVFKYFSSLQACDVIKQNLASLTEDIIAGTKFTCLKNIISFILRKCGHIVCNDCSKNKFVLQSQSKEPVRVCDNCFAHLIVGKSKYFLFINAI